MGIVYCYPINGWGTFLKMRRIHRLRRSLYNKYNESKLHTWKWQKQQSNVHGSQMNWPLSDHTFILYTLITSHIWSHLHDVHFDYCTYLITPSWCTMVTSHNWSHHHTVQYSYFWSCSQNIMNNINILLLITIQDLSKIFLTNILSLEMEMMRYQTFIRIWPCFEDRRV